MASYSQSSQRYVKLDEPSFVYPFNDEEDSSIQSVFIDAMRHAWKAYNELLEMGVSEEDARYVLPNACTTNIVVTMNARELLHFFKLRCCNRAQNEIRELAYEMLTLCIQKDPLIFDNAGPPCRFGECPETNPCGNSPYYNRI
jgi:thymidylate synthase (FAD)